MFWFKEIAPKLYLIFLMIVLSGNNSTQLPLNVENQYKKHTSKQQQNYVG